MAKMSKSVARRRLLEAKSKILKVMMGGHISVAAATKLTESLDRSVARIK